MVKANKYLLVWIILMVLATLYVISEPKNNKSNNNVLQDEIENKKENVEGFVGNQQPINNSIAKRLNNKEGKCGKLKDADKKCNQCQSKNGKPILPVLEPLFNMREMVKQIILLEDHLFQEDKRCEDCICKHFLTIEALAEEAVTLDKNNEYSKFLVKLPSQIREIQKEYLDNSDKLPEVAQKLRKLRKQFMIMSFKAVH